MPDERFGSASATGVEVLALTGVCTLETAVATKHLLQERLQPGKALALDLEGVTEADLTLLQLVIAARRAAEAQGGTLRLEPGAGALVRALAETAGLLAEPTERRFWEGVRP